MYTWVFKRKIKWNMIFFLEVHVSQIKSIWISMLVQINWKKTRYFQTYFKHRVDFPLRIAFHDFCPRERMCHAMIKPREPLTLVHIKTARSRSRLLKKSWHRHILSFIVRNKKGFLYSEERLLKPNITMFSKGEKSSFSHSKGRACFTL